MRYRGRMATRAQLDTRSVGARLVLLACVSVASVLAPAGARADLRDNSVGINTHVPSADLLDAVDQLGVAWIRVDANWGQLEPARDTFDWGYMDAVVDGANARGLHVYMTLAYTPDWVPKVARARSDAYGGNDEPLTSAEWVAFVDSVVRRYRARGVTHFGIWNEPNLGGFWEDVAGVDPYIDKILVPGAAAVRGACGDCRVLGPDLAHVGAYDEFLDAVLTRASASFDIITHHSYNGFRETGWTGLSGDNFLNAIEARRSGFTRIALRELLDNHGWTGEVWITETGYRATVGDATDEDVQAVYVRRVLEEQLLRSWWTNTFFYEITDCGIDQPGCDIDGFGITRPNHVGSRSFPSDYRRKPAYTEIQNFLRDNPAILSTAGPTQCDDGVDNDSDGHVDRGDRGCATSADDNESDDPPRSQLDALPAPAGGVTVDGDLTEWGGAGFVLLGPGEWAGPSLYGGLADLTLRAAARYEEGTLYFGVQVTDDTHANSAADDALYQGDSLQIAFDVNRDLGDAYDDDDHELSFALVGAETHSSRFHGSGDSSWEAVVRCSGSTATYELRLPRTSLPPARLMAGELLGFSFLVNDADGSGREGWLEFTPGIGAGKDPYLFGELVLSPTATPSDAGVREAGVLDAASAVDGGSTPHASGGCSVGSVPSRAPWSLWSFFAFVVAARRMRP